MRERAWSGEVYDEKMKLEGSIGGACPLQGEGELDGRPWYFRARYEHWSFTMAEKDGDVHMVRGMFHNAAAEGGWNLEREWPFGQYSAGYMPVKSGLGIIRACARLYWQDKLPRKEADLVLYAQEEAWLKEWSEGIRRSSYCECSHNQVAHGIGEEGEEKKGLGAGRKCQECECEDFRYSAEQTEKHAQVAVGVEKRGAKLTQTRPNGLN